MWVVAEYAGDYEPEIIGPFDSEINAVNWLEVHRTQHSTRWGNYGVQELASPEKYGD